MKKIISILIIVVLMFSLTSCKKKKEEVKTTKDDNVSDNVTITLDEYNKLKVGMTYEEVTKIVGGNCNKTEDNIYFCSGEYAGTSATLVFEKDKLKEKTQTGL